MIAKSVDGKRDKWDGCIDSCVYAYNTAVHESSLYTPFELMFGRKAILPIDIELDDTLPETLLSRYNEGDDHECIEAITKSRAEILKKAKDNINKAQAKQKYIYDRKHANPKAFTIGKKVLVKDFLRKKKAGGKLTARFIGPYKILKKTGRCTYSVRKVSDPNGVIKKVNASHIKPYIDPPGSKQKRYKPDYILCQKLPDQFYRKRQLQSSDIFQYFSSSDDDGGDGDITISRTRPALKRRCRHHTLFEDSLPDSYSPKSASLEQILRPTPDSVTHTERDVHKCIAL